MGRSYMTVMVPTWRIRTRCSQLLSVPVIRRRPAARDKLVVSTLSERLPAREAAPSRLPDQVESLPLREFSLHLVRSPLTVLLLVQLLYPFPDRPTGVIQKLAAP